MLVIEDHADTADMLAVILESEGYSVRMVSTASEAHTILGDTAASHVDIVLLDLTLPDMNGDDMIKQLRQKGVKLPPILIMSAGQEGSLNDASQSIEAADVVRKPFDIQVLLERIEAHIDKPANH